MRIQPVQGSGMNAGYDAATKSITISNEGNTPFMYFKVNGKIPIDDQDLSKGYYLFYDFSEVIWAGDDFVELEGGLSAKYDTRETCPKLFALPHDLDDPSNLGNFAANVGISGQGLVYLARYRGVDSKDGRDVYEFVRSLDTSSKILIKVDESTGFSGSYYPATGTGNLDNSSPFQSKFWAKEVNGSELVTGRNYVAFYIGGSYDPFPGDPENTDSRPIVTAINSQIAGPSGIQVVTDINCIGGSISATYGTFYPSESAYVVQDNKKSFVSLIDTPASYAGFANYYVAVNPSAQGLLFTNSPPTVSFVPVVSFINLKDAPIAYPQSQDQNLRWVVKVNDQKNGVEFGEVKIIQNKFSIVPSDPMLKKDFYFKLENDVQAKQDGTISKNKRYGSDADGKRGWFDILVNDQEEPGSNMYYGTNSNGEKGWWPLPGA